MIGHAEFPAAPPLMAAVAASVHGGRHLAGYSWVCADGRWGLESAFRPAGAEPLTAEYAELRAVAWLLGHLTPADLLTCNRETARFLRLWQGGDQSMPPGSAGSTHLPRAAGMIAKSQIRVSRVGSHPLTTAAAVLALVARERASSAARRHRAQAIVVSFLADQQQEVA